MQTKRKTKFILILIVLSTILLTFCKSTQKNSTEINPPQIETHFPNPYDENGNAIVSLDGETVSMPLWYWLKITEYVIDVETNKELRNEFFQIEN